MNKMVSLKRSDAVYTLLKSSLRENEAKENSEFVGYCLANHPFLPISNKLLQNTKWHRRKVLTMLQQFQNKCPAAVVSKGAKCP